MFGLFQNRRRARVRSRAFPKGWVTTLQRHVPYYAVLPDHLRTELHGHIQILLDEKTVEGCNGQEIDDRVRLTIAAYAGLLQLNRDPDYYPALQTILVYPEAFVVEMDEEDEFGFVAEGEDIREGESWGVGTVIISWEDVITDTQAFDGRNLILHEFAHQLYDSGEPRPADADGQQAWERVFDAAYEGHVAAVEKEEETLLDPYGAQDPAEFFSVITETFFELPRAFRQEHPELYEQLCRIYRQEPHRYFAD